MGFKLTQKILKRRNSYSEGNEIGFQRVTEKGIWFMTLSDWKTGVRSHKSECYYY
jgi:hypothetical protein